MVKQLNLEHLAFSSLIFNIHHKLNPDWYLISNFIFLNKLADLWEQKLQEELEQTG
jgi:hypothetical protein